MEHINKNRSFSSCIREGYKLFRENMRNIFISTWKQLAVSSLCFAALVLTWVYTDQSLLMVLLAVLTVEGLVLFKARVFDMIDYRPYLWNILRMEGVCVMALMAVLLLGLVAIGCQSLQTAPLLFMILSLCLLAVLLLPLFNVSLELMLEEKAHPWQAYKNGLRRWGFLFLAILLSAMVCGVIFAVVCTPLAIAVYSAVSNEAGIAAGDPSGLPGYFPYLLALTAFVSFYAMLYIQTWQTFAMAFAHGSISYKHENS